MNRTCDTMDVVLARLARSRFRGRFHLREDDRAYLTEKGMDVVMRHADDFIRRRLDPPALPGDGRQTPMRGHPVFVAQHATATCCRGCLEKWHGIPKTRPLSESEQAWILALLRQWLEREAEWR